MRVPIAVRYAAKSYARRSALRAARGGACLICRYATRRFRHALAFTRQHLPRDGVRQFRVRVRALRAGVSGIDAA